jgi:hypothetical protein
LNIPVDATFGSELQGGFSDRSWPKAVTEAALYWFRFCSVKRRIAEVEL